MTETTVHVEPPEEEVVDHGGFIIRKKWGSIIEVTHGDRTIKVGQKVISNGRFETPAGKWGLVVEIKIPSIKGRTTDILEVWWEGNRASTSMKFKDLQF